MKLLKLRVGILIDDIQMIATTFTIWIKNYIWNRTEIKYGNNFGTIFLTLHLHLLMNIPCVPLSKKVRLRSQVCLLFAASSTEDWT